MDNEALNTPQEATTEPQNAPEATPDEIIAAQLQDPESAIYKAFTAAVSKAVAEEVKRRIGGTAPKAAAPRPSKAELDDFKAMTYSQRCELKVSDPNRYNKLNELALKGA